MVQSPPHAPAALDDAVTAFAGVRPRLFGIAYRMLGSATEAEDLVQDVWLRWQTTDRDAVLDVTGFLVTATTRLAINVVQSARVKRQAYVGPWLPEPIDTRADPEVGAVRGEALAFAVMLLLEKLSPAERAAYVLREAFDYPYEDIAEILELGEANVRQLVSRARKHLVEERRAPVSSAEQRRLLEAFLAAAQRGDRAALESLFAADVVSTSDGGGVVRNAAPIPVVGRERVAKFVSGFDKFWAGTVITIVEANGEAAIRIARDGVPVALGTVIASAEGIEHILWVMNPHKLGKV